MSFSGLLSTQTCRVRDDIMLSLP